MTKVEGRGAERESSLPSNATRYQPKMSTENNVTNPTLAEQATEAATTVADAIVDAATTVQQTVVDAAAPLVEQAKEAVEPLVEAGADKTEEVAEAVTGDKRPAPEDVQVAVEDKVEVSRIPAREGGRRAPKQQG